MIDSAVTLCRSQIRDDAQRPPGVQRKANAVDRRRFAAGFDCEQCAQIPHFEQRRHRCRRCLKRSTSASIAARSVMPAGRAALGRQAEWLIALEAHLVQAFQFGDRVRVIVDAEVEKRIDLGRVDQQRRRLLAALVAAAALARRHRGQQSLGERSARVRPGRRARSRRARPAPRAYCRRPRIRRAHDGRTSRCTARRCGRRSGRVDRSGGAGDARGLRRRRPGVRRHRSRQRPARAGRVRTDRNRD